MGMIDGFTAYGIAAAIFWTLYILDVRKSDEFIYYSITEGNKWFADKYGYADTRKGLIFTAAVTAAVGVVQSLPYEWTWWAWTFFAIPIGRQAWVLTEHRKMRKANREKQIKWVNFIRANWDDELLSARLSTQITRRNRTYFWPFQWLWVEYQGGDPADYRPMLIAEIKDWITAGAVFPR